ncbi:PepSY-like domain-containing protein [Maribacter sp.]|nr:PepSY-like domain-containing protein [Maribacter sp.]
MRTILFFITILLFPLTGCAQKTPEVVQSAFEQKYPKENSPEWEIDANGNFEAGFKKKGKKYRADFSPEGKWIETERSIKKKELPKVIQDIIKKEYKNEELVEIEEVDHHSKGRFYDVEFKAKGKNMDVEFKADGQIIN